MTQPTLTFAEHLSEAFALSLEEAHGLFHVAEILDNVRADRKFWNGLRAWSCRLADKLLETSAGQTGGEPTALVVGRARELRHLPNTLRETLAAIDAEGHRWKPDPPPPILSDGY